MDTPRYKIEAFDTNSNQLWITIGTSHVGAAPHRSTNRPEDIDNIITLTRTGQIIDPNTGKPVIRRTDPATGKKTQGKRLIAYFRIYDNDAIHEIHITRYGRKAGVRNYQARRPSDGDDARIAGHAPIHTDPRIELTDFGYLLLVGEGDPDDVCGTRTADRWGDSVVEIATCRRVTYRESGCWWGYKYYNLLTRDHCPMKDATVADVRAHLDAIATETIRERGEDISRW